MPNQYIFDQLLIFVNLDQHAKTEAASSIGSGEIADLKILHSDWLRAFWSISQKEEFSQIFKFKKHYFRPMFDPFLSSESVTHNFIRISSIMPKFGEI